MQPCQESHTKAALLADLRKQIQRLEGFKTESGCHAVSTGLAEIDAALPDGSLPLGTTHELLNAGPETAAATTGFLAGLLARVAGENGSLVWISKTREVYAPGLTRYGLCPERIIFVQASRDHDALWAMEEALRCKGLSAVVGEIDDADLTATRRLQLAAEGSGVTGFLVRHDARKQNSACLTRWQVTSAPGIAAEGMPGNGDESWKVELLRARGGQPGQWRVAWRNGALYPAAEAQPPKKQAPVPKAIGAR